jgi:hypothetical protein
VQAGVATPADVEAPPETPAPPEPRAEPAPQPAAQLEGSAPPEFPTLTEADVAAPPAPALELASEPEPQRGPAPRRVVVDMTRAQPPGRPAETKVKDEDEEAEESHEARGPAEVDRVALTREFAQLFADTEGRDES